MELSDLALPLVIGAMAANQLVMRVHAMKGSPWIFWPLQLLNLAVGSLLILVGLPGFDAYPVIRWILALFFFFRVVLNNNERQKWLLEQQVAEDSADRRAVKEAFLDALRRSEDKEG